MMMFVSLLKFYHVLSFISRITYNRTQWQTNWKSYIIKENCVVSLCVVMSFNLYSEHDQFC